LKIENGLTIQRPQRRNSNMSKGMNGAVIPNPFFKAYQRMEVVSIPQKTKIRYHPETQKNPTPKGVTPRKYNEYKAASTQHYGKHGVKESSVGMRQSHKREKHELYPEGPSMNYLRKGRSENTLYYPFLS